MYKKMKKDQDHRRPSPLLSITEAICPCHLLSAHHVVQQCSLSPAVVVLGTDSSAHSPAER